MRPTQLVVPVIPQQAQRPVALSDGPISRSTTPQPHPALLRAAEQQSKTPSKPTALWPKFPPLLPQLSRSSYFTCLLTTSALPCCDRQSFALSPSPPTHTLPTPPGASEIPRATSFTARSASPRDRESVESTDDARQSLSVWSDGRSKRSSSTSSAFTEGDLLDGRPPRNNKSLIPPPLHHHV